MADPDATPTANYGWLKPAVGASVDVWGGDINADLDGIDSVVHGIQTSVPAASTTTPNMDGTAAVGTGTTWARADHVHPTDTSRASVAAVAALPLAMNDNRIINGDMRIDQRNNGASGTASGYTVDRWNFGSNLATKGSWAQGNASAGLANLGFGYYLGFSSNSAYTSAATDQFVFQQSLEGDAIADFAWGTSSAQPVTLSFIAYSTVAGTFGGSIRNYAATRSYPFSFVLPANAWTKIVVTILGDTAGTWVLLGNAGALIVGFDLGSGSNFKAATGAWTNGNIIGATGATNIVATNGGFLAFTGVKLEVGSVATPFNRQSLAKSMADCQRYYQKLGGANPADLDIEGYAVGASSHVTQTIGISAMRAVPTANIVGTFTGSNFSNALAYAGLSTVVIQIISTAEGPVTWYSNGPTAYLTLSAEL